MICGKLNLNPMLVLCERHDIHNPGTIHQTVNFLSLPALQHFFRSFTDRVKVCEVQLDEYHINRGINSLDGFDDRFYLGQSAAREEDDFW